MKKFLLAIVLLVIPVCTVFGQSSTSKDSLAYLKLNKWAVVKLTIAYMEDVGMKQGNEKKTYDNLKSKYETFSDEIILEDFEKALSDGWTTTKIKVYDKYKKELVDSVSNYNFNNILFKPLGNENSRSIALSQINEKFDSLVQTKQPARIEKPQVFKSTPENSPVHSKTSLFEMAMYLLLVISIFLNIFLFFKFKSRRKEQKPDKVSKHDYLHNSEKRELRSEIEQLRKENSLLKLEIETNKQTQISTLNNNEVIIKEEIPVVDVISETINLEVKNEQNLKKTIYLPTPFEERKFAIEDVSETEKQISLYVAEIDLKNKQRNYKSD